MNDVCLGLRVALGFGSSLVVVDLYQICTACRVSLLSSSTLYSFTVTTPYVLITYLAEMYHSILFLYKSFIISPRPPSSPMTRVQGILPVSSYDEIEIPLLNSFSRLHVDIHISLLKNTYKNFCSVRMKLGIAGIDHARALRSHCRDLGTQEDTSEVRVCPQNRR